MKASRPASASTLTFQSWKIPGVVMPLSTSISTQAATKRRPPRSSFMPQDRVVSRTTRAKPRPIRPVPAQALRNMLCELVMKTSSRPRVSARAPVGIRSWMKRSPAEKPEPASRSCVAAMKVGQKVERPVPLASSSAGFCRRVARRSRSAGKAARSSISRTKPAMASEGARDAEAAQDGDCARTSAGPGRPRPGRRCWPPSRR